jgi:hypothetical protein
MKCERKQQSLLASTVALRELPFGEVAKHGTVLLARVKPVNYLCNSTIINDMISKGNCLCINLQKGTCFITNGDTQVQQVESKLIWNEL